MNISRDELDCLIEIKNFETCSPWHLLGLLAESADKISRAVPTFGRPVNPALVKLLCEEHAILAMALSASVNQNRDKWRG